jgi:elongator complex protein 5
LWGIALKLIRCQKISNSKIIFISFSTLRKKVPYEIDTFITTRGKSLADLRTEIVSYLPEPPTAPPAASVNLTSEFPLGHVTKCPILTSTRLEYFLIIDNLHPLSSTHSQHLSSFLSSLLMSPQISFLATYHTDIPVSPSNSSNCNTTYAPDPLTTLTYLATAILTISSFPQVLAQKRARDKSLQEPVFGLQEGREGVLVGLSSRKEGEGGVVVNMELRRRSGRGVVENFVVVPPPPSSSTGKNLALSEIMLLDDHLLYSSTPSGLAAAANGGEEDEEVRTTFNLGLTEKQKRDREGVILPYFDAQREGGAAGPGDGGRILYDMGAEDREDFDDEEDEI